MHVKYFTFATGSVLLVFNLLILSMSQILLTVHLCSQLSPF